MLLHNLDFRIGFICTLAKMWLTERSKVLYLVLIIYKLDGVGPVDNRPSTAEASPIGKIQKFSKIAVTLEPVMQF